MLGMILVQRGDPAAGIDHIKRSIGIDPNEPSAYSSLGNALRDLREPAQALEQYDRALALDPQHAAAWNNRGSALLDLGLTADAVDSYARALALKPHHVGALLNQGNAFERLGLPEKARQNFETVVRLKPRFAPGLFALATALRKLRRLEAALALLDRFLELVPHSTDAHHDRGTTLQDLQRCEEAVMAFDRAIASDGRCISGYFNRAIACSQLERFEAAAASYRGVLALDPAFPYALGGLLQSKMLRCDWTDWQSTATRINDGVRLGQPTSIPFSLLAINDSPADQLRCARAYVEHVFPAAASAAAIPSYRHERIRVAYLSADFKDHPVAILLAGVLLGHDRRRFEITAVSLRPIDDKVGRRIQAAVEHFVDASQLSDAETAERLRGLEIDIVVDLQGFTQGTRAGILARRPAAVQVNYLGFPATMGADYIDYIVADEVVIPRDAGAHYAERVIRLPHCYLPFDDTLASAQDREPRATHGLPERGFVYCAFNNHYKIVPETFDLWMRLLRGTPASCLWLRDGHPAVTTNLRREAARRGVDPDRLVFAPRTVTLDRHVARHRHADLFLDTLPYGAHATAAVALWAGLPVVTSLGGSFAGRVAASLLRVLDLPQLVAADPTDYERLALDLSTNRDKLDAIRHDLVRKRASAAAFCTSRYRRAFEAALEAIHERHCQGLPPTDVAVPDSP